MHPEFSQLSRYALGEAQLQEAQQVSAHLRDCADCRRRAREISAADLGLRLASAEVREAAEPCPEPSAWSAFLDQTLAPPQRAQLQRHLLACDDCLHRVVAAHRARRSGATEPALDLAAQAEETPKTEASQKRLFDWLRSPITLPRWAAVAPALAALAMVIWLAQVVQQTGPSTDETTSAEQHRKLWEQLAALQPAEGKAVLLAVTPELEALFAEFGKNPDPEQQKQLLDKLKQLEPALAGKEIISVNLPSQFSFKRGDWAIIHLTDSRLEILAVPVPAPKK
jgi:anti-sigma factor RsiW